MRARRAWHDEHTCPLCGYPKEYCQAPETEFALGEPKRIRCHITTRLRDAQKAYASLPTAKPEGLLWVPEFRQ